MPPAALVRVSDRAQLIGVEDGVGPHQAAPCNSIRPAQRSRIASNTSQVMVVLRRRHIEMGADGRRAMRIGAAQREIHAPLDIGRRPVGGPVVAAPPSARPARCHRGSACAARYGPCRDGCADRRRPAARCRHRDRWHWDRSPIPAGTMRGDLAVGNASGRARDSAPDAGLAHHRMRERWRWPAHNARRPEW